MHSRCPYLRGSPPTTSTSASRAKGTPGSSCGCSIRRKNWKTLSLALGESGAVSATWASRSAAARWWARRRVRCSWTARIWCRCDPAGNGTVHPASRTTATGGSEPGRSGRSSRDTGAELGKRHRPPGSPNAELACQPRKLQFPGSRTAAASAKAAQTSTAAGVLGACPVCR
ncbi:hypothetical protein CapIbe_006324 [Capra ibex]